MVYVSRFVDEDAHFDEVPGCPLRHARSGYATVQPDESACSSCRYNVVFPRQAAIGCVQRTPTSVVDAAAVRAGASLATELHALRAAGPVQDHVARQRWSSLGTRWLAQAAADDDDGRELASVMIRFSAEALPGPVEILR